MQTENQNDPTEGSFVRRTGSHAPKRRNSLGYLSALLLSAASFLGGYLLGVSNSKPNADFQRQRVTQSSQTKPSYLDDVLEEARGYLARIPDEYLVKCKKRRVLAGLSWLKNSVERGTLEDYVQIGACYDLEELSNKFDLPPQLDELYENLRKNVECFDFNQPELEKFLREKGYAVHVERMLSTQERGSIALGIAFIPLTLFSLAVALYCSKKN